MSRRDLLFSEIGGDLIIHVPEREHIGDILFFDTVRPLEEFVGQARSVLTFMQTNNASGFFWSFGGTLWNAFYSGTLLAKHRAIGKRFSYASRIVEDGLFFFAGPGVHRSIVFAQS